jgi:hypothetical protein
MNGKSALGLWAFCKLAIRTDAVDRRAVGTDLGVGWAADITPRRSRRSPGDGGEKKKGKRTD